MSKANGKIEIGDTVRIRWPILLKKSADNATYTVKEMPLQQNMGATWWTLLGDQNGELFSTTEVIMLEVLN